jgi:hypothetical protein
MPLRWLLLLLWVGLWLVLLLVLHVLPVAANVAIGHHRRLLTSRRLVIGLSVG